MTNFRSDNESGVAPEIMAAILEANAGTSHSYGDDDFTARLERRFADVFEKEVGVFVVLTGGAANGLAVAQMCPPYGSVYCHEHSHLHTDECGGPEFFSGGAKLMTLPGEGAKIDPDTLEAALAATGDLGVHECLPSMLSLTQATEFGTVYDCEEIAELSRVAAGAGLGVHMDGARFANALVTLGCSAAEMTWKSGVDMLSFGATKNGAMAAEALIVFEPERAAGLGRRRKRAGHLVSKMRFVSAQLLAYLTDGLWLRSARAANAVAAQLAAGLAQIAGVELLYPVQSNEVFLRMPQSLADGLRDAGFEFHPWPGQPGVYRLVTSFNSTNRQARDFLDAARRHAAGSPS